MASLRPGWRPAAAAAAVALLASGCATVPTLGRPEPVTGAGGQVEQFVKPIPPVPGPNWTPVEMVQGFLAASASFSNNHAAAKRFLAPNRRKNFEPSWAVTVVKSLSVGPETQPGPANLEKAKDQVVTVKLTGQQLASISNIGQYNDSPGTHPYRFKLAKMDGQWLITDLPRTSLLLTQADFEEVYQPRNLYFWAPTGLALVPEPIFAPEEDSISDVATNLVKALLNNNQYSGSWLVDATTTDFPIGTSLAKGGVSVSGASAVVNLTGTAASVGPQQLRRMAAQLVATLTSSAYGQAPISRSVVLEINGKVADVDGHDVQEPQAFADLVPGFPSGSLYFVGPSANVSVLAGKAGPKPVAGPVGHERLSYGALAISPTGPVQLAGSVTAGRTCEIYYGGVAVGSPVSHRLLPGQAGACTSLSWDSLGDIWAVTARHTWVLPPGSRNPVPVILPPLPGSEPASYKVLALRMAADGVRAAMLIQTPGSAPQVVLTAVTRTNRAISLGPTVTIGTSLPAPPTSLSWYDADHLIVVSGSQLYEVPANGGAAVSLGPVPPATKAVTSAGPGHVATASSGVILRSAGPDEIEHAAGKGTTPAYPG